MNWVKRHKLSEHSVNGDDVVIVDSDFDSDEVPDNFCKSEDFIETSSTQACTPAKLRKPRRLT